MCVCETDGLEAKWAVVGNSSVHIYSAHVTVRCRQCLFIAFDEETGKDASWSISVVVVGSSRAVLLQLSLNQSNRAEYEHSLAPSNL